MFHVEITYCLIFMHTSSAMTRTPKVRLDPVSRYLPSFQPLSLKVHCIEN